MTELLSLIFIEKEIYFQYKLKQMARKYCVFMFIICGKGEILDMSIIYQFLKLYIKQKLKAKAELFVLI